MLTTRLNAYGFILKHHVHINSNIVFGLYIKSGILICYYYRQSSNNFDFLKLLINYETDLHKHSTEVIDKFFVVWASGSLI
jgi:hypothetical protein